MYKRHHLNVISNMSQCVYVCMLCSQ